MSCHSLRIYVNSQNHNRTQDGNSWKTAYASLQAALDRAASNLHTNIWVAAGTYFPSKLYSPSEQPGGASHANIFNLKTFDLPDHVTIFGGFQGCEKKLCQRDLRKNKTIL